MQLCKAISLILMLLLPSAITLNVYAGSVHTWVDVQGVTHYSDQPPKTAYSAVTQIDVSDAYSSSGRHADHQEDYYSITNQWARMREERLERKQLQLEKAKQKSAQQPAVPQIVYVNKAEEDRSGNTYYPAYQYGSGHQSYGHRLYKTYNNYARKRNRSTCQLPNADFYRGYARSGTSGSLSSGLTLRIR